MQTFSFRDKKRDSDNSTSVVKYDSRDMLLILVSGRPGTVIATFSKVFDVERLKIRKYSVKGGPCTGSLNERLNRDKVYHEAKMPEFLLTLSRHSWW